MPMINQVELDILRSSLGRLIGNQTIPIENTQLLYTSSGISIHGFRFDHINMTESMIQNHLSISEIEKLPSFNEPNRRNQYYIGRVLAKRCLCDLIKKDYSEFRSITVDNDTKGKPFYNLGDSNIEFNGVVSISHKSEYVIAACTTSESIGLDFEKLTRHSGLARRISKSHNEDDISQITAFLGNIVSKLDLDISYVVIWSALEAGYKAFSFVNPKSPLDFKLRTDKEGVSIMNSSNIIQFRRPVYFVHAGDYILSIVT